MVSLEHNYLHVTYVKPVHFPRRWAFWINLPLGGIALVVCFWLLPLKTVKGGIRQKLMRVDYVGSFIAIVFSILLLLGLTWGGVTHPWTSAAVLVPLILSGVMFALFLVWEAKFATLPIMPMRVLKNKTVVGVCICNFLKYASFILTYLVKSLTQPSS